MKFPEKLTLNNGLSIPAVGLGTLCAKEHLTEIVKSAVIDYGYRHIDTARNYENEQYVGEAIQSLIKEGKVKREDLFITTKIFNHEKVKGEIEPILKDSLKKLKLDYVDLVLVHWPIGASNKDTKKIVQTPLYQTWSEFEDCCKKGLCKSIGVSNFGVQLLLDMFTYANIKPAVNQIEVHPYLTQEDLVGFCQEQGIVVEAYSPLGSLGTLDWRPCKDNILKDEVLTGLAAKYKKSNAQIALNWGLNRKYVIIPKTEKKERLQENMLAANFTMDKADYDKVSALNRNMRCFDTKYWDSTLHIPMFA